MSNDLDRDEEYEWRMRGIFPKMFDQSFGGFAVDEGWWHFILEICRQLQHHVNTSGCEQVVVEQVKEKFGTLRFYFRGGDETCHAIVGLCEGLSASICEVCGKPGERRQGGWIKTLCDKHEEERQQRMKERLKNENRT